MYGLGFKDYSFLLVLVQSFIIAIPYTIKVTTGGEEDMSTEANVFVIIMGAKKKQTTGRYFVTQIVYSLVPIHSNTIYHR